MAAFDKFDKDARSNGDAEAAPHSDTSSKRGRLPVYLTCSIAGIHDPRCGAFSPTMECYVRMKQKFSINKINVV